MVNNVIQFKSESDQIHVQLPLTNQNLDIMTYIIQGMKKNNGGDKGQVIKQLNNDIIKSSNDEINKEDDVLKSQLGELVDSIQSQKDANKNIMRTELEPDMTMTRPSQGTEKDILSTDKSLIKDKKKKKKTSKKKKGFPYQMSDDMVLVKNKDTGTGNISVYKPVIRYLLNNLSDKFSSKHMTQCIYDCFNDELGRNIKKATAQTYVFDYRQYLLDFEYIKKIGSNVYEFIRRNEEEKSIKHDGKKKLLLSQ